jgi:chromosome segregation ATPase
MTKPTGRPRGRPRKPPKLEETPETAPANAEESEEVVIEERIAELEAELTGLEGPPPPLTATDIAQGAVALADKHEQRRSTTKRLLVAFKVKHLEIRRSRYEREMVPFVAAREAAGERLEELEGRRIELQEEIGKARADWGDANTRAESKAQHVRRIDREIRGLRGGGGTA